MSPVPGFIGALGGDYRQWRALVRALIKVGFRTSLATEQMTQQGKRTRFMSWMTGIVLGVVGVYVGALTAFAAGPFPLGLFALSTVAIAVFFLLLANFQAVAISPMDYQVLGHRPVSPRTYLLARLTVTLAHQGINAGLIVGPSVVICGVRFGWFAAIGLAVAAGLLLLSIVLALIGVYAWLIEKVGASRLGRAMAYSQLFLGAVYLVPVLFTDRLSPYLRTMQGLEPEGWLLALPSAWFAGLASLVGGAGGTGQWLCAALALGAPIALGWASRDRLSLASAQKLEESVSVDTDRQSKRRRQAGNRKGLGRLSVASGLIRGQFRHDTQFRMGVFGLVPLVAFYFILALRNPGSVDPFVPGSSVWPLFGIHFALLLAPTLLLEQLHWSTSYRAGWIFFSTPVDRARLAADARHCVTLYFLVPFLALAAACLAWLFEAVWHALAHVVLLGLLGVFLMQASQYLWPRLPFTMRPVQRRQTGLVMAQMACLGLMSGLVGPYASFAYLRPAWAIGTFAVVACCVVLMETRLPRRLNRRLRWLEAEG